MMESKKLKVSGLYLHQKMYDLAIECLHSTRTAEDVTNEMLALSELPYDRKLEHSDRTGNHRVVVQDSSSSMDLLLRGPDGEMIPIGDVKFEKGQAVVTCKKADGVTWKMEDTENDVG